jgi:hypothetical protein
MLGFVLLHAQMPVVLALRSLLFYTAPTVEDIFVSQGKSMLRG